MRFYHFEHLRTQRSLGLRADKKILSAKLPPKRLIQGGLGKAAVSPMMGGASSISAQLYARHASRLQRYLRRFVDAHQAEDCAQEAFERWLKHAQAPRDEGAIRWIFRTARNLAIDVRRRQRRLVHGDVSEEISQEAAPDTRLFNDDLRGHMFGAAHHMDNSGRHVLLLGMLLDSSLDQEAIAERLGVSTRTVRRMTAKLFQELERELGMKGFLPSLWSR